MIDLVIDELRHHRRSLLGLWELGAAGAGEQADEQRTISRVVHDLISLDSWI